MTPEWDVEQLEVIIEPAGSWQMVTAGPGTGKSEVACQRIAFLVDDGLAPTRILLVSFTRTAVAELRDRIIRYSGAGARASGVRISTIDSQAWRLRAGFDDDPFRREGTKDGYELNIQLLIDMFTKRQPELLEFMQSLEHVVIDEAQDVVGRRARLVIEMLRSLGPECGVTILADPAQAIYGFTTDDDQDPDYSQSLLEMLEAESPRNLVRKELVRIHRTESPRLLSVYTKTREALDDKNIQGHLTKVQETIRDASGDDIGIKSFEELVDLLNSESYRLALVLFRRRAEALLASSYCSSSGLEHRLRMSGMPITASPWVGWLFGEAEREIIPRNEFDLLWERQKARAPLLFEDLRPDKCWEVLHKAAAAQRAGALDLVQLRRQLAKSRPPLELTVPECGVGGPILGTIHASKGRESNTVILVIPKDHHPWGDEDGTQEMILEEGRVYYVGATRARQILAVASNVSVPVSYLDSRRVYRLLPGNRVQFEIGREHDLDRLSHLAWSNAKEIQEALARSATCTTEVRAVCMSEQKYSWRIELGFRLSEHLIKDIEIAEMSQDFRDDLSRLWGIVDTSQNLKPPHYIQHLYLIGATTVGLADTELSAVREPYSRTGIALAPVIKGFPTVPFLNRWHGGNRQ